MKVSNAPGGKSNFSLGWGSDEVEAKPSKKQFSNQNQQSFNIFGDNPAEKTSVKVESHWTIRLMTDDNLGEPKARRQQQHCFGFRKNPIRREQIRFGSFEK